MHSKYHELNLDKTAHYIRSLQQPDGAILWNKNDKLDPWDHVEAAMGLSVTGFYLEAERAYTWLAEQQCTDGSWQSAYFCESPSELKETNFIAYIATGVWLHYQITQNEDFLKTFYPVVKKALDFVLRFQQPDGEISWAVNRHSNEPEPDALLTACASIARSIECGIHISQQLDQDCKHWSQAWQKLCHAVKHKPECFDRTWESKARFAMDWYYPILAGLYSSDDATARLDQRWQEFIEPELGCRCVTDEPWVTMAETSELVMALVAANDNPRAEKLFKTLAQWQQDDGGFVTGYVFRDKAIWPEDKTSWTAGAVLLAADALYQLTPAHALFTQATYASAETVIDLQY